MSTLIENRTVVAFPAGLDAFATTALDQQQQTHIRETKVVLSQNITDERQRERTDSAADPKTLSTLPITQHALLVTQDRSYSLVLDFPVPSALGPYEVLIRNRAVGLNHIDWMSVEHNFCLPELPWITGRELAGIVERVGKNVTSLRAGDAVWTSTYYKDRRAGCFQELVTVPEHTVFPIPKNLNFAGAACLGVGGLTAAMTLWRWLGVPMPDVSMPYTEISTNAIRSREKLLVWGGSTVTGQFAIQLAAQAGLDVIAVCSASTVSLVSALGAKYVVSYTGKTDMHIIGEILCFAQGGLTKAIDLVGSKTARLVLQVIRACGTHVDFAPLAFMGSKDLVPSNAVVHTVEMKQFVLDPDSAKYGVQLSRLIERGLVKVPKLRLLSRGWAGIEPGLRILKNKELKGEKLVILLP